LSSTPLSQLNQKCFPPEDPQDATELEPLHTTGGIEQYDSEVVEKDEEAEAPKPEPKFVVY